ncbi:hypothetical protein EDB19DRAFT_1916780 [Suillus lakei]|nr:hypothetical protein EDB19DRAFT_1916780 [Suillus lakei]
MTTTTPTPSRSPACHTRTVTAMMDSHANHESFWSADTGVGINRLPQQSAETLDVSACTVQDMASTSTDQGLPFPLHFRPDQELGVQYIPICNMTVKALKALCGQFGLTSTGTKSVLREHLELFS